MAELKKKTVFNTLRDVNVNEHTERKKTGSAELTYLSWAWAWDYVKSTFPSATYVIHKFGEEKLPYQYVPELGYMVWTSVTIDDETLDMWLPVMDSNNKAMKSEPYTYKTKTGDKTVEAATMFDINKTIMRCLVKNLGMFGLGLYIYSGEDLPETEAKDNAELEKKIKEIKAKASKMVKDGMAIKDIYELIKKHNNGSQNPDTIDSIETAEKVMAELNDYKPVTEEPKKKGEKKA